MRTTVAIATFLAVGVSAAGVGALNLKGSDTLKDMTIKLLTEAAPDCGGAAVTGQGPGQGGSLIYDGTGSGNGEANMLAKVQQIAPMSKPMDNSICTGGTGAQATAEGIVFELDGISLVGDKNTWDPATGTTCNGHNSATCTADSSSGGNPTGGLAYNNVVITPTPAQACSVDADCNDPTSGRAGIFGENCESSVCVYHLTTWKQALRILYFGVSSTDASGNAAKYADRNCGSPERKYLAAHWTQLLQNCPSGDTSCPAGVQHAFRRNDESGTSDVFSSLLGVPKIGQSNNQSPFCNTGTSGPTFLTASPPDKPCTSNADCGASTCDTTGGKCNILPALAQSAVNTIAADHTLPAPSGGKLAFTPTSITLCPANGKYIGSYFTDLQDADVIRRACKATSTGNNAEEDVCSARGDLGLVLPIWDVPATSGATGAPLADAFPTTLCSTGIFTCVPAVQNSCPGVSPVTYETCPDGSNPNDTSGSNLCPVGQCEAPAISGTVLNPRCKATKNTNWPGNAVIDGRVYNETTWTTAGTSFKKVQLPRATGLVASTGSSIGPTQNIAMVGAYYRIHSVHTMDPTGTVPVCQKPSSTDQIGCLVHASPCSIGYAGNSAADGVNSVAFKINNVDPNNLCVQNFLSLGAGAATTYQLSRKLYLNSIPGFESLTGTTDMANERKMAECFANGTAADIATGLGFIPLPATNAAQTNLLAANTLGAATNFPYTRGQSFCEDFTELGTGASPVCSGTTIETDACADNTGNVPSCHYGADEVATGCHFGPSSHP